MAISTSPVQGHQETTAPTPGSSPRPAPETGPGPQGRLPSSRRTATWCGGACIIFLLLFLPAVLLIDYYWPYRYRQVKPLLENVLAARVTIAHYHRTYFPYPGFVATGVTLRRATAPDVPPIGTADTLFVQGRWSDLFLLKRQVQLVDITRLHFTIPAPGTRANREDFPPGSTLDFSGPDDLIKELNVHNSLLEIERTRGGQFLFPIHDLVVRDLQKGHAVTYVVDMRNALPAGVIHASGSFGPLNPSNLPATPVTGDIVLTDAHLSEFGQVGGTVAASGHFEGQLDHIQLAATTHTPDFFIAHGRPTPLDLSGEASLNGLNGDFSLNQASGALAGSAASPGTAIQLHGTIAGSPKVADLDLSLTHGHVQDLLHPFLHGAVPFTGPLWLKSHIHLDPLPQDDPRNHPNSSRQGLRSALPQPVPFLRRLHVTGDFSAPAERITDPDSEKSLTDFSHRAQKSPDPDQAGAPILSSLSGPASIHNAVLATPHLNFRIPGAQADLLGSLEFHTARLHLTGNLRMENDISHVTTGFKSILLKPLAPFFRKDHAGAVVPIAITGVPGEYKVSSNLLHRK